jgi:hypothetical protein
MTRKRFWDDPSLTTLDFSSGQTSDAGPIGGRAVLAARKEGSDIVYALDQAAGLAPGDGVRAAPPARCRWCHRQCQPAWRCRGMLTGGLKEPTSPPHILPPAHGTRTPPGVFTSGGAVERGG